jgi:acetyl-CoA acetyltransferase
MSAADFSRKYAIVGTGIVTGPFDPATTARAAETEAARLAIEDAGLRRDQVDGAVQARRAGGAGDRASFTDAFPRILGLPFKFYYSVGRGGAVGGLAMASALMFLDLGLANYIVVSGAVDDFNKSRVRKREARETSIEKEGYWGRPFGDTSAAGHHSSLPLATWRNMAPPASNSAPSRCSSGPGRR